MPSTYTTRNRLEKQAAGENRHTWGIRYNDNVIDLSDFAMDGMVAFTLSGTKALTSADGAPDEARARYLNITGGTGGTVEIPNVEKIYLVRNGSSDDVTFTTGSGTTTTIAAGAIQWVVCEGGNVVRATFAITADETATLTNKTINLTDNSLTGTLAQFNAALSDDDFVTPGNTATLTGKTISLGSNTITMTLAQLNTAVSDATVATLAGAETLTNKTLAGPVITSGALTDPVITGAILEDIYTISDGASVDLDPSNGTIQLWTLGANRTPTATNWQNGESMTLMVDDGLARTITWSTIGVNWVGGSAPTLATTGYSVIELWKVGGQMRGAYSGPVA